LSKTIDLDNSFSREDSDLLDENENTISKPLIRTTAEEEE
jgi:hypothetical protein